MTEHPDRIERTLEVLLYAPIGIGLFLKDAAPTFVNMFVARGRAEIDRRHDDVQQRVTTARSIGQVALAFGPPMVRKRVEDTVADARRRAEGIFGAPVTDAPKADSPGVSTPTATGSPDATAPTPPTTAAEPAPARTAPTPSGWAAYPADTGDAAGSAELPIPGYDALSASQVVERLIGLDPDELNAVHEYEATHRQRRTILGKIEQLAG